MPWDSIWNEGGGGAVPVGTLGGKITIIHRRKSKVASRVVNSHCPIPRRLTSSINWNENSVANGLIPCSCSFEAESGKLDGEDHVVGGKFVIYEFGNAWNPKGPGEATGHHLLPSGTAYAGHVGLLSKIREKLPRTLVPGVEHLHAENYLANIVHEDGIFRPPLKRSSRNTFARRSSIMFDIDNSANIENVNFERGVLLIIILDESKFEIFWIN